MYAFPCIKKTIHRTLSLFIDLWTYQPGFVIGSKADIWWVQYYRAAKLAQIDWEKPQLLGFLHTSPSPSWKYKSGSCVQVCPLVQSVIWQNLTNTSAIISVCFIWQIFTLWQQQKFEKFWDFFEKSNFFLNAKILEKIAKLWKPQNWKIITMSAYSTP
jgi:hypothetical protein